MFVIEAIVAGVTTVTVASLSFAKWVIAKEDPDHVESKRRCIVEKRRVMERDRNEWMAVVRNPRASHHQKEGATTEITRIDKTLLNLADDEMKL